MEQEAIERLVKDIENLEPQEVKRVYLEVMKRIYDSISHDCMNSIDGKICHILSIIVSNLIDWNAEVIEWCSICDFEVVIEHVFDGSQRCPVCGEPIYPCGSCGHIDFCYDYCLKNSKILP